MKSALPAYASLYEHVRQQIGPDRKPVIIGLDGESGSGKSSAASWLAWQFEMPSIHLDLFLVRGEGA